MFFFFPSLSLSFSLARIDCLFLQNEIDILLYCLVDLKRTLKDKSYIV